MAERDFLSFQTLFRINNKTEKIILADKDVENEDRIKDHYLVEDFRRRIFFFNLEKKDVIEYLEQIFKRKKDIEDVIDANFEKI